MKKALTRALLGAPVGVTISLIITIIISLFLNDGGYHPVVPELAENCGGELKAVILQSACSVLYGAALAGASVIWEKDNWSLLRQTLTHLAICSLAVLPIAYFMHWMEHSLKGAVIYFGIFAAIYLFIWLSSYFSMKKRLEQINRKMHTEV